MVIKPYIKMIAVKKAFNLSRFRLLDIIVGCITVKVSLKASGLCVETNREIVSARPPMSDVARVRHDVKRVDYAFTAPLFTGKG